MLIDDQDVCTRCEAGIDEAGVGMFRQLSPPVQLVLTRSLALKTDRAGVADPDIVGELATNLFSSVTAASLSPDHEVLLPAQAFLARRKFPVTRGQAHNLSERPCAPQKNSFTRRERPPLEQASSEEPAAHLAGLSRTTTTIKRCRSRHAFELRNGRVTLHRRFETRPSPPRESVTCHGSYCPARR